MFSDEFCEVCGRPATHGVLDLIRETFINTARYHTRPDGDPHYFCVDHAREPEETELNHLFTRSDGRSVFNSPFE